MPSFDIVSEVDLHEVTNAVDQANREVGNRFDFKGTDARIERTETSLSIHADNDFQVRQVQDILYNRMAKRGIDVASLATGEIQASGTKAQMTITVQQGIDQDAARKLVKKIKETRLKVQASIQGEKVRVTGKKRDDLQSIISQLDSFGIGQPLQAENFRD